MRYRLNALYKITRTLSGFYDKSSYISGLMQGADKFDFVKVHEPQSAESFSAYSEQYALQLRLLYYAIIATISKVILSVFVESRVSINSTTPS